MCIGYRVEMSSASLLQIKYRENQHGCLIENNGVSLSRNGVDDLSDFSVIAKKQMYFLL